MTAVGNINERNQICIFYAQIALKNNFTFLHAQQHKETEEAKTITSIDFRLSQQLNKVRKNERYLPMCSFTIADIHSDQS
jgi:hypothetical protein